jgi:hypothetical protein
LWRELDYDITDAGCDVAFHYLNDLVGVVEVTAKQAIKAFALSVVDVDWLFSGIADAIGQGFGEDLFQGASGFVLFEYFVGNV